MTDTNALQELTASLQSGDDVKLVRDIGERQAELRRLHEKKQLELKEILVCA